MKTSFLPLVALSLLVLQPAFGQPADKPVAASVTAPHLTTFDLDFPGGTPQQLVTAIQKSMGHPLNAVIPVEYADVKLPPLKMSRITVAQLFRALDQAVVQKVINGRFQTQTVASFRTADSPDRQSDESVWTFYTTGQSFMPSLVQFYLLTPYLKVGLTVDDITTAIQTAWRMSGANPAPSLTYHKETNLLIAAGDEYSLNAIAGVLHALDPLRKANEAPPATQPPAPAEKKS